MRLTVEDHAEAIKRYRHVKRARGRAAPCGRGLPGVAGRTCTRERGHRGPHVAHGRFGKVRAVWEPEPGAAKESRPVPRGSGGPIGLPSRSPVGFLRAVGGWLARTFSSVEDVALLILFLAFVWFALDWLLLIL